MKLRSSNDFRSWPVDAIINQDLFDQVQAKLNARARRHRASGERRVIRAPLSGKPFDVHEEPMSPTTSRGNNRGRTLWARPFDAFPHQTSSGWSEMQRRDGLAVRKTR